MNLCYCCKGPLRRETGKGRIAYWASLGAVDVPEGTPTLVCTKCKESWIDPTKIEEFRTGMRAAYGDPSRAVWDAPKVLRRAVRRIGQGWVQGHLAIDQYGEVVLPRDATAVCWSLEAAIGGGATLSPSEGRSENEGREICEAILRRREQRHGGWVRVNLQNWNDDRRRIQPDVLVLLKEAIEEAEDRLYVPGLDCWP